MAWYKVQLPILTTGEMDTLTDGLRTAVEVLGNIRNPSVKDKREGAEIAKLIRKLIDESKEAE